jgi:hypothetical protein
VAAGYGATHDNISGIILLAPGHFVSLSGFHANFKDDLARAEQMISEGNGDVKANFGDINMGRRDSRWVTAKIYHSWFAPNGPADFEVNMTRLKKDIAVLYIEPVEKVSEKLFAENVKKMATENALQLTIS